MESSRWELGHVCTAFPQVGRARPPTQHAEPTWREALGGHFTHAVR